MTAGELDTTPDQFNIGAENTHITDSLYHCGQSSNATNLVPYNANLIARIQVSRILDDVALEALFQQAPKSSYYPQNFEELLT